MGSYFLVEKITRSNHTRKNSTTAGSKNRILQTLGTSFWVAKPEILLANRVILRMFNTCAQNLFKDPQKIRTILYTLPFFAWKCWAQASFELVIFLGLTCLHPWGSNSCERYVSLPRTPQTPTTKIHTFFGSDPYKPSFATLTGWGVDPNDI